MWSRDVWKLVVNGLMTIAGQRQTLLTNSINRKNQHDMPTKMINVAFFDICTVAYA